MPIPKEFCSLQKFLYREAAIPVVAHIPTNIPVSPLYLAEKREGMYFLCLPVLEETKTFHPFGTCIRFFYLWLPARGREVLPYAVLSGHGSFSSKSRPFSEVIEDFARDSARLTSFEPVCVVQLACTKKRKCSQQVSAVDIRYRNQLM